MIDIVKRFFGKAATGDAGNDAPSAQHDIRVAVCALFIEMGRIDNKFTPEELGHVLTVVRDKYGLPADAADELMATAERELDESVDLWQFAHLINKNYRVAEKIQIIEILWEIVYVDGKMDDHEHYLMNKLSNLLRLSHSQLIEAKLKVRRKK